ncbi:MAG: metallophosphoesterase [Chromatiaceae bacterium]|jgi:3',5'-cyclic AMP phosphodiesterase CpdA
MSTSNDGEWILAHLSDPHLTRLEDLRATDLMNKRVLGYLSWRRRRRHEHRSEVLDALLADLESICPDHVAITGDLTHLGTRQEFEEVSEWLKRVGPPARVTVVPGNHDAYTAEPWEKTYARWAPYMCSDEPSAEGDDGARSVFPSLRVRGDTALIGASSAVPSLPFFATGRIGRDQLDALSHTLHQTGEAGLFRVLLLHHPPVPGSIQWRKRLTDAPDLASVISRQGVELVLHGHAHRANLNWLTTPGGRAPAVGVRSASELSDSPERLAEYHIFRVRARSDEPRISMSVRRYSERKGGFVAVGEDQVFQ